MKIAGASDAYRVRSAGEACIQNSRPMIACLNTLSLNAPKHWVTKNGRKRRCRSNANCECPGTAFPMRGVPPRAHLRTGFAWPMAAWSRTRGGSPHECTDEDTDRVRGRRRGDVLPGSGDRKS